MTAPRTQLKTYSHLLGLRRKPTPYEVMSSQVLYSATQGIGIKTPTAAWHDRYKAERAGSGLRSSDWEKFQDPRATTYAKYTQLQRENENFVDGLLRSMEDPDYDANLPPGWLETAAAWLSAARFPCHGLQMASAYVGQLAPSGRIAIACLFQSADEVRRIQRFAQRLHLLRAKFPESVSAGESLWIHHDAWQPLRRTIEQLLVTYDWGEAFAALNLSVKPAFDRFLNGLFLSGARANHDLLLEEMMKSLAEDCRWHADWATNIHRILAEEDRENAESLKAWKEKWDASIQAALQSLPGAASTRPPPQGAP